MFRMELGSGTFHKYMGRFAQPKKQNWPIMMRPGTWNVMSTRVSEWPLCACHGSWRPPRENVKNRLVLFLTQVQYGMIIVRLEMKLRASAMCDTVCVFYSPGARPLLFLTKNLGETKIEQVVLVLFFYWRQSKFWSSSTRFWSDEFLVWYRVHDYVKSLLVQPVVQRSFVHNVHT